MLKVQVKNHPWDILINIYPSHSRTDGRKTTKNSRVVTCLQALIDGVMTFLSSGCNTCHLVPGAMSGQFFGEALMSHIVVRGEFSNFKALICVPFLGGMVDVSQQKAMV